MRNSKYPLFALGAYLALIGVVAISSAGPAHTQSGGTRGPDVRVVNTAEEPVPVSLQGAAQIDTSSPIPVRDIDRRPQQPVQFSLNQDQIYTVPAGKELVIEFLSGSFVINLSDPQAVSEMALTVTGTQDAFHVFAGTPVDVNTVPQPIRYAFSQPCRIYAGPGDQVRVRGGIIRSGFISGHLVDAS